MTAGAAQAQRHVKDGSRWFHYVDATHTETIETGVRGLSFGDGRIKGAEVDSDGQTGDFGEESAADLHEVTGHAMESNAFYIRRADGSTGTYRVTQSEGGWSYVERRNDDGTWTRMKRWWRKGRGDGYNQGTGDSGWNWNDVPESLVPLGGGGVSSVPTVAAGGGIGTVPSITRLVHDEPFGRIQEGNSLTGVIPLQFGQTSEGGGFGDLPAPRFYWTSRDTVYEVTSERITLWVRGPNGLWIERDETIGGLPGGGVWSHFGPHDLLYSYVDPFHDGPVTYPPGDVRRLAPRAA